VTRVRGSIDIDRPVEEVFEVLADQRTEVTYNPRMTESVKVTPGPVGVGTRFRATVVSRGTPLQMTIECTGFDRPHRLASRSVMDRAVVDGEVRCHPAPGGTRLSWDWEVTVSGPARFAGPLIGWFGRRQEQTIWTGLKRHLEGLDGAP
jgi:carbon monoxide dehydrogenase subunit G